MLAQNNRAGITRGREEIANALETWAFGERDPKQRDAWLKQVSDLADLGPDFRQTVLELIEYANDNTTWAALVEDDVTTAKRQSGRTRLARKRSLRASGRVSGRSPGT